MHFARILLIVACFTLAPVTIQAQSSDPRSDPRVLFDRAKAAQQSGDNPQAIQLYRVILKMNPNLLPAWINLGVALVQAGQLPEAIESYRSALNLDPHNRQIQYDLALAYFKKGDTANASRQFEELLQTDPHDVRVATLLGAVYLQAAENDRALAVLTPLAIAAGENPDFLWSYGAALIANGKLKDGVAAVEKVAQISNAPEAWMLAGQTLLRLNEFVRAKVDLETAARLNPALPGVQTALGHAREKNADYQGAVEAFNKATNQDSKDADAWLALGSDQYFQRDLQGAGASLKRALDLDPASAPALYALALVEKSQSRPGTAAADLEQAVKIRPDWMEAHVQLAALYFQLHRAADGARERQIVDRLSEDQRKAGPGNF